MQFLAALSITCDSHQLLLIRSFYILYHLYAWSAFVFKDVKHFSFMQVLPVTSTVAQLGKAGITSHRRPRAWTADMCFSQSWRLGV